MKSKLPSLHKLHGLDHLRAFAITIVFLFHYGGIFAHPDWVKTVFDFGWTGVDLFFVLSGFLIASQLFAEIKKRRHVDLKTFFIKRVFRIIPAYLLVVAIYFSFPFTHERGDLAPAWKFLTFTQNLGLDQRTEGTFSHAWSLCIEEQFYLLLPLALSTMVYFRKLNKGWIVVVFLFIFGFIARVYAWDQISFFKHEEFFRAVWMKWLYYPTYARLDSLLAGVSVAAVFQFKPMVKTRLLPFGNEMLAGGLFILIACWFVIRELVSFRTAVFGFPLIAVGYGLVVAGAVLPSSILYRVTSTFTSTIATLSYAIYLSHKIIIHVCQQYLSSTWMKKDSNLMFLLCIICSVAAACIIHRVVEKPFMLIRNRLLQSKQKPAILKAIS